MVPALGKVVMEVCRSTCRPRSPQSPAKRARFGLTDVAGRSDPSPWRARVTGATGSDGLADRASALNSRIRGLRPAGELWTPEVQHVRRGGPDAVLFQAQRV